MSNIIKDTAAKVAGNVTQSVASAVIVFVITTYVLVDFGKKEKPTDAPDTATVAKEIVVPSASQGKSARRTDGDMSRLQGNTQEIKNTPAQPKVDPTTHAILPANKIQTEETSQEVQKAPAKNQIEQKLDATVATARAKADTLLKDKKQNPEVKGVQKRADDVFDELDEEAAKKPPQ